MRRVLTALTLSLTVTVGIQTETVVPSAIAATVSARTSLTCRAHTVRGLTCLDLGQFRHVVAQGPNTPAKLAGPIRVRGVKIVNGSGIVQHNPSITVLLWGSEWHNHRRYMGQLVEFYARLAGSAYNAELAQYNNAGNNPTLLGAWIDPLAPPFTAGRRLRIVSTADIRREIGRLSARVGLSLNPSTHIVLALPPGVEVLFSSAPGGSVPALHDVVASKLDSLYAPSVDQGTFTVLSFPTANGGAALTDLASHEYVESVTDPKHRPAAFVDPGHANGEIGDVCEGTEPVIRGGLTVVRFFSRARGACVAPELSK